MKPKVLHSWDIVCELGYTSRLPAQRPCKNMSSVMFLCLILMSSICFGNSKMLVDMECQSAEGVIGQTTRITCSFKMEYTDININGATLHKGSVSNQNLCFGFRNNIESKRSRFKLAVHNKPSLLLSNTLISDEGEYVYVVYTSRGDPVNKTFSIAVTAKFNTPVMSSWPEKITNGQKVDLYCNSSGGYPAGTIQWFDHTGTNWTASSTQESTVDQDKLLHLSSKLSFTSIDDSWAPFKCVVLNSKGIEEEQNTLKMESKGDGQGDSPANPLTSNIVAPMVVIGSLIVGLLLLLLFRRRRARRSKN